MKPPYVQSYSSGSSSDEPSDELLEMLDERHATTGDTVSRETALRIRAQAERIEELEEALRYYADVPLTSASRAIALKALCAEPSDAQAPTGEEAETPPPAPSAGPVAWMFRVREEGQWREFAAIDYLLAPDETLISKTPLVYLQPAVCPRCGLDLDSPLADTWRAHNDPSAEHTHTADCYAHDDGGPIDPNAYRTASEASEARSVAKQIFDEIKHMPPGASRNLHYQGRLIAAIHKLERECNDLRRHSAGQRVGNYDPSAERAESDAPQSTDHGGQVATPAPAAGIAIRLDQVLDTPTVTTTDAPRGGPETIIPSELSDEERWRRNGKYVSLDDYQALVRDKMKWVDEGARLSDENAELRRQLAKANKTVVGWSQLAERAEAAERQLAEERAARDEERDAERAAYSELSCKFTDWERRCLAAERDCRDALAQAAAVQEAALSACLAIASTGGSAVHCVEAIRSLTIAPEAGRKMAEIAARYQYWRLRYRGTWVIELPQRTLKFDCEGPTRDFPTTVDHGALVDAALDAAMRGKETKT